MEQIKINKILLMTAIGIFTVLAGGSIAVVHASIIGDTPTVTAHVYIDNDTNSRPNCSLPMNHWKHPCCDTL
jgi:hypothetical protein